MKVIRVTAALNRDPALSKGPMIHANLSRGPLQNGEETFVATVNIQWYTEDSDEALNSCKILHGSSEVMTDTFSKLIGRLLADLPQE